MDAAYWRRSVAATARNLADRRFARDWLAAGLAYDARARLPTRDVHDAYPEITELSVDLGPLRFSRSNMDPSELFLLAAIARIRSVQTVFEIGTYDGSTTSALATACPTVQVLTLDLPEGAPDASVDEERSNVIAGGVGARFAGSPIAERIVQLRGDSRTFDFTPWFGSIDMVIVDGGHEEDCVSADTGNAMKLVRPDGIVVWDDYTPGWPAVVATVDSLPADVRRNCFRPAGSQLAIWDPQLLPGAWV